jgi:hypothetical protein
MLTAGTKVRDRYQHSETHVIVRKTKAQRASDVRYFGSEAKADQWYRVRSDVSGGIVMMHADMMVVRNEA